jgi:hypothetical protein
MRCAACAADLGRPERVGRRDTCVRCGADLHACRNCRFYDPRAANECREPGVERVLDKTRSNFCEYFTAPPDGGAAVEGTRGATARDRLERLFRKG